MSEREGNDSTGDGTQKKPFKTVLKVSVENTCFVWRCAMCSGALVFLNVSFIPIFAKVPAQALQGRFWLILVISPPFLGIDDSGKRTISYNLCGFPKRKRGAVALKGFLVGVILLLLGVKGHSVICCLLLSPCIL